MLNKISHDLAHKYIITELVIRTLERDRQHVGVFETKDVMDKFGQVIRKAKDELMTIKNEMGKIGLQDERKLDDTVTVYSFMQRGILTVRV